MNAGIFRLDSFPGEDPAPRIEITGSIGWSREKLTLSYIMAGEISKIAIPAPSPNPARKCALWETTCFEFFVAPKGARGYWEFNLSPSGDWNVYHFTDYRQDMSEEKAFSSLPFLVDTKAHSLSLFLELEPATVLRADTRLEIAISAVVKTVSGNFSYHALRHCGKKPDFHRRECFEIEL